MIKRDLEPIIIELAKKFPVIAILGPRQSGKTTLAKITFPSHTYISLEDFDIREIANSDPRAFLDQYKNDFGIILDEIQHAPQLLSYIQTAVDKSKQYGYFIVI